MRQWSPLETNQSEKRNLLCLKVRIITRCLRFIYISYCKLQEKGNGNLIHPSLRTQHLHLDHALVAQISAHVSMVKKTRTKSSNSSNVVTATTILHPAKKDNNAQINHPIIALLLLLLLLLTLKRNKTSRKSGRQLHQNPIELLQQRQHNRTLYHNNKQQHQPQALATVPTVWHITVIIIIIGAAIVAEDVAAVDLDGTNT